MRTVKFSNVPVLVIFCCLAVTVGCVSQQQYKDLKMQNDAQQKRIAQLESELQATTLEYDKLKRLYGTAENRQGIEADALQQKIAALEEDLANKKDLIAKMQQQLLFGGALPVELNTMLEDFANSQEMVTYDSSRGVVKFKSDLLFEPGSDIVAPAAKEAVRALCGILNSEQAKDFNVIIAGHTDDIPIGKPDTRQKHPTNWYLSAHRAIAVLDVMSESNIAPERMSVRGFGEYQPVVPNEPNKKGNPQNRRVEIYIVPKGV
jgi:chemotaxis protein MotB